MTVLRVSAKNLSPEVNYNLPNATTFNEFGQSVKEGMKDLTFTLKNLKTGVYQPNNEERKKLNRTFRIIRSLSISMVTIMIMNHTVHAETLPVVAPSDPQQVSLDMITPDEVLSWCLKVALIAVAGSTGMTMILLSAAGMYRALRQRQKAQEWTTDIIKGFVQSLIAIPVTFALYYLATALFANLGL